MQRLAHVALLVAVAIVCSSCSWVFSRPPDRRPLHAAVYPPQPLCKPGYVAPAFDTYNAVSGGVLTLLALSEAHDTQADTFGLLAAITAGLGALSTASATYGFKQARACRELRTELARGPRWITPSERDGEPVDESWPPEVEQHVDVDENQIDVHTTIRRAPPPPR